jgi:carboxyl-terminal processing protease
MPVRNIFVIALSAVISLACYSAASKNRYANLFAEALDIVDREALQDVPQRELFTSAMNGMMKKLDEHSVYISDQMFQAFDEDLKQQFGGVGMYVDKDPTTGRLIVLAPIPDTPAFLAGIQVGDAIVEIEGKPTEGIAREDAITMMRGPKGKNVNIVIERDGKRIALQLVRAVIPVPSVHGDWRNPDGSWNYFLESHPRIGYVRLLQFGNRSVEEMAKVLDEVDKKQDALILDLRNNTGGLLDAAIGICEMFLDENKTIVSTRGRNRKLLETFVSHGIKKLKFNKPLVILVNRNSASASEIVSGCLQDHNRAIIVGEQTWGKGTVQHVIPMEKGKSALKLTTASYWRPSGKNIDRSDEEAKKSGVWGVQPNPGFEIDLTDEIIFEIARQRNQRDVRGFVQAANEKNGQADDGVEPDENRGQMPSTNQTPLIDQTLQRAIKYLETQLQNRDAA